MSNDNWYDPPSMAQSQELYRQMGIVRGQIIRLKRTISEKEDELKRDCPRKPHERNAQLKEELDALTELEVKEVALEWEVKFTEKWIDLAKAMMYRKG